MRSHDQHADVALKSQKRKSSSKKRSNHALARSRWPRVTISRDSAENPHEESDDTKRKLPCFSGCSTVIDTNHSDVIAYRDIVDLFCESSDTSNEGRTTCQISSSTELDEDSDVCSTCKDCAECQLQLQQKTAKTEEELMNNRDEELAEHLDYYEGDISGEAASTAGSPSTVASMEHEEAPILVDLTSEESKQTTWKQTILKQFDDAEENSEMSGENVITSKSGLSFRTINVVDF